jgi:tetratricopeptide (TPR) repeat protein
MIYTLHIRREMERTAILTAAANNAAVARAAAAQATLPVPPPPPVAAAQPGPAAVAPEPEPTPTLAPTEPAHREPPARDRGKHHHAVAPAAKAVPANVVAAPSAASNPALPTPAAAAPAEPVARGPREVLAEADKLLGQGEVAEACGRGEEAKKLGPRLPAAYKFLGKCYMRAGRAHDASENYKQYLELAPNAPDAPFVKSMIK